MPEETRTRVVVTGLGIVAPNANNVPEFERALREGRSGIRYVPELEKYNFRCRVGGIPQGVEEIKKSRFDSVDLMAMTDSMVFSGLAALECWEDAGLRVPKYSENCVDWGAAAVIGTGCGGAHLLVEKAHLVDSGNCRRLGGSMVEQVMVSAASAKISGLLGLGGQVTTNSSACATGTEAVADAFWMIRSGRAKRVLAGGCESYSHYGWAGFDAMRVLVADFNDQPERASRPMSASASGFVPGTGAGILLLESLDAAQERGARIHAEVLAAHMNSGGQRGGGSMTAPNPEGVRRCIRAAIEESGIAVEQLDLIGGHLTGTFADVLEVKCWQDALGISVDRFPFLNATKSIVGHALGAAGGIECVASVLQIAGNFVHPSLNTEDLKPELKELRHSIPLAAVEKKVRYAAKASFGFGDVNGCIIFGRWGGA